MLSLRAFARSAPRCTARLCSYTTRTAFRPAFQPAIRSAISTQTPRGFASSVARFDATSQQLAAKLDHEITLESEENSNPAESDRASTEFLSENPDWKLEDTDGDQEVLLRRKFEDEDITVAFSIVDFNTPPMEDESDEALMDEEEEIQSQSGGANTKGAINQGRTSAGNIKVAPEDSLAPSDREELRDAEDDISSDEQPAFPANVDVLIQRPSKGALRINLVANEGNFTIQSVTHLPDNKTNNAQSASELLRSAPESLYTGPPFQQLDEDVQTYLESYLEARGINTALAMFIPEYIDVKEQKEYLGWLQRLKNFVE